MSDDPTTTHVRELSDDVVVIGVDGDLTPATEDVLMGACAEADIARAIVLDFTDLHYMNSGGIGC